jgi:hypothetical protein
MATKTRFEFLLYSPRNGTANNDQDDKITIKRLRCLIIKIIILTTYV